ncbi:MAG TPA: hypothetical protein VM785_03630, partial [Gaiellales bacterium]|nr:hypothetical protein [Gaiellales bacterium]
MATTTLPLRPAPTDDDIAGLEEIEQRVLWLAVRIVDHANRERPSADPLKVGGHQASSASMVSLMTALYAWDLEREDRVSVKPHASPVLHALEYLLGRLDRRYLSTLRDFGGLQAYPSRTKDPFPVDYSTGSVGLGAAAPLFGALTARYVEAHFDRPAGGRFISLLGDAELDEGNVWEAILDPATRERADRPTVIFAYTVKGYRLPIAGQPLNHSAHLTGEQIDEVRRALRADAGDEWAALDPGSPGGRLCAAARERLGDGRRASGRSPVAVAPSSPSPPRARSTQEAFGRVLVELAREQGVGERVVTAAPDVSVSTNLGGWINRVGVFGVDAEPAFGAPE